MVEIETKGSRVVDHCPWIGLSRIDGKEDATPGANPAAAALACSAALVAAFATAFMVPAVMASVMPRMSWASWSASLNALFLDL